MVRRGFNTLKLCLHRIRELASARSLNLEWTSLVGSSSPPLNRLPLCRAMGFRPTAEELADLIEEIDEDGSGAIEFPEFAQLCAKFLVEDPDPETMRAELKQAFRLFDKQGTVSSSDCPALQSLPNYYSVPHSTISRRTLITIRFG